MQFYFRPSAFLSHSADPLITSLSPLYVLRSKLSRHPKK